MIRPSNPLLGMAVMFAGVSFDDGHPDFTEQLEAENVQRLQREQFRQGSSMSAMQTNIGYVIAEIGA